MLYVAILNLIALSSLQEGFLTADAKPTNPVFQYTTFTKLQAGWIFFHLEHLSSSFLPVSLIFSSYGVFLLVVSVVLFLGSLFVSYSYYCRFKLHQSSIFGIFLGLMMLAASLSFEIPMINSFNGCQFTLENVTQSNFDGNPNSTNLVNVTYKVTSYPSPSYSFFMMFFGGILCFCVNLTAKLKLVRMASNSIISHTSC
eukprot:Sdes_comp19171_c0_seq2m9959